MVTPLAVPSIIKQVPHSIFSYLRKENESGKPGLAAIITPKTVYQRATTWWKKSNELTGAAWNLKQRSGSSG
jgi:hypothetical protein